MDAKRVAVVGAGLSGLTCARKLADHGFSVEVFEKSRGAGGRMSTRRADSLRFDHGAQYFTVGDDRFRSAVEGWISDGVVQLWPGTVAVLGESESMRFNQGTERFVGVPGMNSICKQLADGMNIHFETRVQSISRQGNAWKLSTFDGELSGEFDVLVLSAPAAQSADLLQPVPTLAEQVRACQMSPCWAAMLAFEKPVAVPFDAAFVHQSPLAWIARNSNKPMRSDEPDAWVVHASSEWTIENETMPRAEVAHLLADEFTRVVNVDVAPPFHAVSHFWRYAIASEPLGAECLFEESQRIAVCGDWCHERSRVEGAFLSGLAVAERLFQL